MTRAVQTKTSSGVPIDTLFAAHVEAFVDKMKDIAGPTDLKAVLKVLRAVRSFIAPLLEQDLSLDGSRTTLKKASVVVVLDELIAAIEDLARGVQSPLFDPIRPKGYGNRPPLPRWKIAMQLTAGAAAEAVVKNAPTKLSRQAVCKLVANSMNAAGMAYAGKITPGQVDAFWKAYRRKKKGRA